MIGEIMQHIVLMRQILGAIKMRMTAILSVVLMSVLSVSPDDDSAPPNEPPHLWRASATLHGEEVMIQIARPKYEVPRKAVSAEPMKWHNLRTAVLDKSIRAFSVDGKQLEPKVVIDALKEPRGVAVFVRYYEPLLEPDPFYLNMLREGTLVFVVAADAISDPIP